MTSFLLFTLQAPLASWGEIAVGEWRGSWDRPSRSAVIGVLGAALGIARHDASAQRALRDGYGVGVRGDALGTPMQDFHTMQTVAKSALKKRTIVTRADVLAIADRETVLSRREYRADVVCTIAVWTQADPRWSLGTLSDALRRPAFALFAGRRSNPLGLPVRPQIVDAGTLADALAVRPALPEHTPLELQRLRPRGGWGTEVAHDGCNEFASGLVEPFRQHVRRDVPTDRLGWLFEERIMHVGMMPPTGARE